MMSTTVKIKLGKKLLTFRIGRFGRQFVAGCMVGYTAWAEIADTEIKALAALINRLEGAY